MLIPKQDFLRSRNFDRSAFLQRINRLDIFSEEAATIGTILKLELSRLKALCKRMHISAKPLLCFNFSNVVRTLLEAIAFWFDEKIVSYQTEILDEFLAVTATTDLNNPMAQPIRGLQRQPSIEPGIEMETFRDEKQKVIFEFSA